MIGASIGATISFSNLRFIAKEGVREFLVLVIAFCAVSLMVTIQEKYAITTVVIGLIFVVSMTVLFIGGVHKGQIEKEQKEEEAKRAELRAEAEAQRLAEEEANKPKEYNLPLEKRFEHTLILGGTGAGKTSLLRTLILSDMLKANRSVVVFDSKGSLADELIKLDIPRERYVVVDPTDERPIALGLFDFPTDGVTRREKEQKLNQVIELLSFVFGALDTSTTSKQDLPLRYLLRLCLTIPDATLLTLRDLLGKDGIRDYEEYVQKLPETARMFFQQQYLSRDLGETREQLRRRVYTILENPTLERMFSQPKARFNIRELIDNPYYIIVNTAKGHLGEERSAFFSRFMVALITQAVQSRELGEEHNPCFIYIDEAAPIIDKNITNALETLREYKAGIILAFQLLNQIPHEYQQSVIANTSIKYLSALSGKDARALADDVRSHADNLLSIPKLSFLYNVRGEFTGLIPVNPRLLATAKRRKDLKQLYEENREKYGILESYTPSIVRMYAVKDDDDLEDLNKA